MYTDKSNLYGILFTIIIFLTSLTGCRMVTGVVIGVPSPAPSPAYEDDGPPPWAPAYGHRAKHQYHYYPSERVYFDPLQRVYFYLNGGRWQMSVSLPSTIRITVNDFVTLDMDSDRPYEHHNEVIKRYPPGQLKKKNYSNKNNYNDDEKKNYRDDDNDKYRDNDKKNSNDNDTKNSKSITKENSKLKDQLKSKNKNKGEDDDEDEDEDKDKHKNGNNRD